VHSVCFSCDTRLLLSGSRDETVRLWNLDLRRNIVIYRADAPVWDAQFCDRGVYFASATASKCVSLYSTERIHPLRVFTDANEDVTCVDFHPNCNFVVGGSDDNNIYMWDVLTGSAVQVYSNHKSLVHSVKVSN
jgi:transcription initiation factor TFIID subunit 5